ncbi:MAG: efflux RND transporter periplasmic adaptor subunit [Polyangiaceae bacterium]
MSARSFIPATSLPATLAVTGESRPASSSRSRGRRWIAAALVVVAAGVGLYVATTNTPAHALTAETSDLPRVEGRRIVFGTSFAERIGLETHEVNRQALVPAFSVVGTVTFDPAHVARVGARIRGVVRDVYRFEGAVVKAGEALATLNSPELGEAQAAVAMLKAENEAAQRQRAREQLLASRQLTTLRDVEEAHATAERTEALLAAANQRVSALAGRPATFRRADGFKGGLGVQVLSSPLQGTVVERNVAQGQLVDAEHVAFLVANLDHLWVELSVFERSLPSIKRGDSVEIHSETTDRGSGEPTVVNGEVAQVGAILNAETRGAVVRVRVDNRDRRFRPGQSVNAVIRASSSSKESVPMVPSSSVVYVDGNPTVFVADTPTSVVVTQVELGETNGQEVHIKSGLEPSLRVVTTGTTELRNLLFR